MCTENQLARILKSVSSFAKEKLRDNLCKVILYGSYARGDYDKESDIDIMIIASVSADKLKEYDYSFCVLSSEIGLENDVVVSIILKDAETFNKYSDVLPFYKNVLKEGIDVA
ncbi:MAG: nucleotidyltransferase domain-containing protein [Clostridia bacterium]|nr:nucleotidyltransferase domain-containing protein [Clostridia bacterium]